MWGYYEYVPVAKKKEDAQKALLKLKKKKSDIRPVVIDGNKLAKTWWGISWNRNLESYADYTNRISRGRSYVKNGFVFDLQIKPGCVTAAVAGSRQSRTILPSPSIRCQRKNGRILQRSADGVFPILISWSRGNSPKSWSRFLPGRGKACFLAKRKSNFLVIVLTGLLCASMLLLLYMGLVLG